MRKLTTVGEAIADVLGLYKAESIDLKEALSNLDEIYNNTLAGKNETRAEEAHQQFMKASKAQEKAVESQHKLMKEIVKVLKDIASTPTQKSLKNKENNT